MLKDKPQLGINEILKAAFGYWNKTLKYQLVFSIIYFLFIMLCNVLLISKLNLYDDYVKFVQAVQINPNQLLSEATKFALLPEVQAYVMYLTVAKAVIFPLNIGFYQMFKKLDLNKEISTEDLFVGFRGTNFFRYFGYALFWGMISLYANSLLPLGIIWVLITLLNAPLMFFANKTIFEGIALNFNVLKKGFVVILVCATVAFLFSYSGVLMFLVGYAFTFPFWNSMIYALYKNFFDEVKVKD